MNYLKSISNNPETIEKINELFDTLVNKTKKYSAFVLYGNGLNGKSMFSTLVKHMFPHIIRSFDFNCSNHSKFTDELKKMGTYKMLYRNEIVTNDVITETNMSDNEIQKIKNDNKYDDILFIYFDGHFKYNSNYCKEFKEELDNMSKEIFEYYRNDQQLLNSLSIGCK